MAYDALCLSLDLSANSTNLYCHAYMCRRAARRDGITFAVTAPGRSTISDIVESFFRPAMLTALSALTILLIASGHLVWWLEKKTNSKNFPDSYLDGVDDGIWWSIVTMTTGQIISIQRPIDSLPRDITASNLA